jgi:hypothetical protein
VAVRGAVLSALLAAACARESAVWDPIADPELPGAAASALDWPEDAPLPPGFETPPWLTMPEPGRIAVGWRTVDAVRAQVVLEMAGAGTGTTFTESAAATLHHVDLGLLPGATTFRYRVVLDGGETREGVFTTPGLEEWRFIHLAEFHAPSYDDEVSRFADAIRAFRPQLVVESGDMVNDGDEVAEWVDYLETSRPWISNVILLPAHSNHVNGPAGSPILTALFDLPENERWYTTRYGAVEFVTLDSTYDGSAPDIDTQPAWIEGSMEASRAAPDPPLFTVAAWHYPACSSHYASRHASRRWVIENLVAAFVGAGGLDLILVGHDKYYERSILEVGGLHIPHLMANAGKLAPSSEGDNEPECAPIVTDTETRSLALFGVSPDGLFARVIDQDGAILDELTVSPSHEARDRLSVKKTHYRPNQK